MNKPPSEGEVSSSAGLRLELFVEDMEATISFYTQVLFFALVRHEAGSYASLRSGSVILGIGPIAKLPEEGGYFTRVQGTHRPISGV